MCEHSSRLMQYSPSPQPNHEDDDAVSHPRSCREPLGVQKANIITAIFQYFFPPNQPLPCATPDHTMIVYILSRSSKPIFNVVKMQARQVSLLNSQIILWILS